MPLAEFGPLCTECYNPDYVNVLLIQYLSLPSKYGVLNCLCWLGCRHMYNIEASKTDGLYRRTQNGLDKEYLSCVWESHPIMSVGKTG